MKTINIRTLLIILLSFNISFQIENGLYSNKKGNDVVIGDSGDNIETAIKVGDILSIKIKGNPTTGFIWMLDPANLNKNILKPLNLNEHNSAEYIPDTHPEGMVGFGGNYKFKFEALAEGNIDLKFINKQPWMPDIARTVSVKVKISSK